MARPFAGRTFVVRIDRSPIDERTTFASDLAFLIEHDVRPIVVAPTSDVARTYVRTLNRHTNVAVGLSGADAALLPAAGSEAVGRVQTRILATLTAAGYVPVIEPTAFGFGGNDVALDANDVAAAIAAATDAARALFFHAAGGVVDKTSHALLAELTPAEALDLVEGDDLDDELRAAVRAAAYGVRAGVGAAQIVDGRIAHATIVELLTDQHLGTQVAGTVYLGAA
jgi:acetylglutamate kinase